MPGEGPAWLPYVPVHEPSDRHAYPQRVTTYLCVVEVRLHLNESHDLKGKRKVLHRLKAQLRQRFGASVAEVDHHDLWQRARLTLACAAREPSEAARLLADAERFLASQDYELVNAERRIVSLDD